MRFNPTGRGIRRRLRRNATCVALMLVQHLSWASDPAAGQKQLIEQPRAALADSLRAIARQTGVSVLFDPAVVSGQTSSPVSGRMSAAEAIERAIDGTGLSVAVMQDGAIVVRPAAQRTPAASPRNGPSSVGGAGAAAQPRLLAQVGGSAGGSSGSSATRGETDDARSAEPESHSGQRIEVTGTRLRRIAAEGPVPVNVYSRADIERSGQPTLERFLATLNEASMSAGEGASTFTQGQGTVQLRGLPLGSTLVLLNGRRVQAVGSSSADFFNLNLIPVAAVERIEVVPVGSSAVYGGDALAGVVNIILRRSLAAPSLSLMAAGAEGTTTSRASLALGDTGPAGSYLLVASLGRSTPLNMGERDFFLDADYRRFGGRDVRTRNCTPGTVTSGSTADLPGLDASFAAIPVLADGAVPTLADYQAAAGTQNLCNLRATGRGLTLAHGSETAGLHASVIRALGASWSWFAEATLSRERLHSEDTGLSLSNVLVPASNPYNPFGVGVRVTTVLGAENGLQGLVRKTDYSRWLGGLRGDFAGGWDLELTVSTSRDSSDRTQRNGNTNTAARTTALASASPDQALNPFTTGRAASEAVLRSIWSDGLRESRGRRDQVGATLRGPILQLPAGSVDAVGGVELARDDYQTYIPGDVDIDGSRRSGAAFVELRIPLAGSDKAGAGGWQSLVATMAARHDRYSDFGSAGTYQGGIEVRPTRSTLLRGSVATSFKPPTLLQTRVDEFRFPSELFGLVDPLRGNEPIVGAEVLRTANPAVGPERGRAYALGAVWEPGEKAGTRVAVTAWRVQIDGLIAVLSPQVTLDNESLFPGFVTRGPAEAGRPGPVTRLLNAEVNFGGVDTAGADLDLSHAWVTPLGRLALGLGATHTERYRVTLAPGAAEQDRVGRRFVDFWSPPWKGRASVGLTGSDWSAGLTSRYVGAYKDAGTSDRRLGDAWVHDVSASFSLKPLVQRLGGGISKASLVLSIANVTGREPQYVDTSPFYDVTQADWRGRFGSVRLTVDW